jgi:hypothetical protein
MKISASFGETACTLGPRCQEEDEDEERTGANTHPGDCKVGL